MTKEEFISLRRLAELVDRMNEDMVTKDLLKSEIDRIDQALENHRQYSKLSSEAETGRINDILKANGDSNIAATKQAEDVAKTLRELVETTRSANAKSQAEVINPILNRLSEIEQKQYENKGKEAISDPMISKLVDRMEGVAAAMSENKGKGIGATALWGYIIGAVGLVGVVIAIVFRFV